ncbi:hypothetical protein BC332_33162 [Capsicum chinense]|nr:hypothetical protein BC332_33162 [Capsicum chinense]
MPFFLTSWSFQTLSDPKVIDEIKMELFGSKTITRKIILEGGANDAPLTVFETISHYDYDHNGCTNLSPDFAVSSECSSCKCQDCKTKHDRVINSINALTASVKEMKSKRGVIPSQRISYPDAPLEIKVAKRRRKDTSKTSSIIKKNTPYVATDGSSVRNYCTTIYLYLALTILDFQVDVTATVEEHNMIVDNPSTASKDEVLVVVVLIERHIQVYDSMSRRRRSGPSSEIQKLAKILPTYLNMSGFLDQKVCTDWSTIEAYQDKIANLFDVQNIYRISQQTIGSLDCGPFIVAYVEYLSDGLQVQMMNLMSDYSAKDMLLFYGNMEKQKLISRTQPTLKIHDDQSRIP